MDNSRIINGPTSPVFETTTCTERDLQSTSLWNDFLSLVKIGIVNSNLITAFTGIWLALYFTNQNFIDSIDKVLLGMLGNAFVIAGGCVLNNYIDRDIDHIMERTKTRPTVTGSISLIKILLIGLAFSLLGLILLLCASIPAAVYGFLGLFTYVVLYTLWTKRRHPINTIVGSFSGAAPPLIGWAAIDPNLSIEAIILFLIMFIWQPPHFYALAMKKCEEYRKAGIPMLPVVRGFAVTKKHIVVFVAALLPLPFFLASLGTVFLTVSILLSVGWFILGLYGFIMKDDLKWAKWMFIYSLNYLTIIFVLMVIVTI
ncbi:heme o synthase [Calidifontibacillus erzurumensis]|uniref:Protoheme IX farnesyltransferase n=1 Tax=Calidifontibacillus erzurumensis TaxID=2741433 RepID=A0A8J8GCQ8_9BACI|nr:heme o synthase [Calidifontibacillus erzurumensis]NSL50741.1 protoheme IX farnesyltransferase [Calidifontibacillus erzurumensis]